MMRGPSKLPIVEHRIVTPGFFGVTRQRLIRGRMLRASDMGLPRFAEVAVVNEALAKRDFPGQDVVGKRFHTGDTSFAMIVGVVSDIKNVGPISPPAPEIYETYQQGAPGNSGFAIVVRVKDGDPLVASKSVQAAIRSVDHGAAISRVRPMSVVIAESVGRRAAIEVVAAVCEMERSVTTTLFFTLRAEAAQSQRHPREKHPQASPQRLYCIAIVSPRAVAQRPPHPREHAASCREGASVSAFMVPVARGAPHTASPDRSPES
jgi:hypothetical protein